jgi:hypothetical protein
VMQRMNLTLCLKLKLNLDHKRHLMLRYICSLGLLTPKLLAKWNTWYPNHHTSRYCLCWKWGV